MSIRLHELAKRIGLDNKELLALLKARDYPVKTVSSTIDKITAAALDQELGHKQTVPEGKPPRRPWSSRQRSRRVSLRVCRREFL